MAERQWKSFSALNQFMQCERQFYYRRIAKIPEPPSHYLAIGILYHEAIEALVHGRRNNCGFDLNDLYNENVNKPSWSSPTSKENLLREIEDNLCRLEQDILDHFDLSQWTCEKFHKYLARIDVLSPQTPVLNEAGKITGVIDEPCVLDWKVKFSTRNRRTQEDVDTSPQLALYCLLEGVNNAAFVEIPRSQRAPINILLRTFDDDELSYYSKYFTEQAKAVESRGRDESAFRLAAPEHRLCTEQWCPFWARCPGGGNGA